MGTSGDHYRVIVVGAGFAGASFIRNLRTSNLSPRDILVVDRSEKYVYLPLIHEVATGRLGSGNVVSSNAALCRNRTEFLRADVDSVSLPEKTMTARTPAGKTRTLSFDYLVFAGGASPAKPPEGIEKHLRLFWSLDDALWLRARLASAHDAAVRPVGLSKEGDSTVAIVGGGTTGVELACEVGALFRYLERRSSVARRSASPPKVVLCESSDRLMGWLDPFFHEAAMERLSALGVEVRLSEAVESADPETLTTARATIPAATKVWTAGIGIEGIAKELPGDRDGSGRLRVTGHLTLPDDDSVYVIGDSGVHEDRRHGPLPPTAATAVQQGPFAADDLTRRLSGARRRPEFEYFDRGYIVSLGPDDAAADALGGRLRGRKAHALYQSVLLYYLRGRDRRTLTLAEWSVVGRLGRLGF